MFIVVPDGVGSYQRGLSHHLMEDLLLLIWENLRGDLVRLTTPVSMAL